VLRDLEWRLLLAVLLGGTVPMALDALIDREWPDAGPRGWTVWFLGLAVIGAVGMLLEAWVRRRRTPPREAPDDTGA
jgi:hypothetical protein